MNTPQVLCLVALTILLGVAAWGDLKARIISNPLNAAIALLALPWWWANGLGLWPGVAVHVALAAGVLLLFALLFAFNMIGGGDVKLLAALGLWLPAEALLSMLWAMALIGGVIAAVMLIHRRLAPAPAGDAPRPAPEVPYGVAIALATMPFIANRILTTVGA